MNFIWEKYGIDPEKVTGGKTVCPQCGPSRKNKRDKSLSVDLKTGLFNCHHSGCDFRGIAVKFEKEKKTYVKPVGRLEKLSKKSMDWFESRGITNNTTLRFGITEAKEWMPEYGEVAAICFNYLRDGDLVNIKFRGPKKSFKLAKDAELIFYNLDSLTNETTAVIVEGEIDALSCYEAGIFNVVSVPNGASMGKQRLEYLDNSYESFEPLTKVILAVDNDAAGLSLREELARRIGKEKCFIVNFPADCKDANDVLVKHGKEALKSIIDQATDWPMEGIKTMDEMYDTISAWYEHGYPAGAKTGIVGLDHLLTFAPGHVTTITGIPGHGKDEFTNLIMASLAKNESWVWGICGFEEEAEQTVTKLIEKFTGKCFDFRKDPIHRITVSDFEDGVYFVDKFFHFYNTEKIEFDIESLLQIAERLVVKFGIKGLVLNPWNWIDNVTDMDEVKFVSWAYSKIIRFARQRGVHVVVIAHTTKMIKDKVSKKFEVPNLYNISGSAHFYNKTHNGMTIYRDDETVDVYVQKVKQSWLGQRGFSTYQYDTMTRQYEFLSTSELNNFKRG